MLRTLLCLSTVAALIASPKREIRASYGSTPNIDGILEPHEWSDAFSFATNDPAIGSASKGPNLWTPTFAPVLTAADSSLVGFVKYDEKSLYFGFNVTDDFLFAIDGPRWCPHGNPGCTVLNQSGWPWFGDEMEILLNAAGPTAPGLNSSQSVIGNESQWQMVTSLTKSRLGGIGVGGLLEGEPRSSDTAWNTYQKWIDTGVMRSHALPHKGGKGYVIEWAIDFELMQIEKGKPYSPAMEDTVMGLNIALGDVDLPSQGDKNYGLRHENWFSGDRANRTHIVEFGTLVMVQHPRFKAQVLVNPGDDLQALVQAHPAGTTFMLQPGVYRKQEVVPKDGQSFIGAGQTAEDVVLSGAALINASRDSSSGLFVVHNLTATGTFHGPCIPDRPRCNFSQDLFLNREPLLHVASKSAVDKGKWFFDLSQKTVWLADDPTGNVLELGTARRAFGGSGANITIANLTVMQYAVTAQNGAVGGPFPDDPHKVHVGAGWLVTGCILTLNHGAGAHLGATFLPGQAGVKITVLRNSRVSKNGQLGVNVNGNGVLIEHNSISGNNFAGFSQEWEAGGVKVADVSDVVMRQNRVFDNNGTGLWADICSTRVDYLENLIVNNSGPGISHEISSNSTIRGNRACFNGWGKQVWLWGAQIQVQNSAGVVVSNNTAVVGTHNNGLAIQQQNRTQCADKIGLPFHAAIDNVFSDNSVYYLSSHGQSGAVADFLPADPRLALFSPEANNTWTRNAYFVSDPSSSEDKHWQWDRKSLNFTSWRQASTSGRWAEGSSLAVAPASHALAVCV